MASIWLFFIFFNFAMSLYRILLDPAVLCQVETSIDLLKSRKYRSNYNERMLLILAPQSIQERLDERLHYRLVLWRYTAAYAAVNRRWKIDEAPVKVLRNLFQTAATLTTQEISKICIQLSLLPDQSTLANRNCAIDQWCLI